MANMRIGVIGTGFIGDGHIQGVKLCDNADLVAVCDVDASSLKAAADKYNATGYASYQEMIDKENLDGIIIGTPDHLHRAPFEAAAEAGIDVLLEKPIATTVEDAKAMIKARDKAGIKLMIAYILRFVPPYQEIHKRIESGELGEPISGYAKRLVSIDEGYRLNGRVSVLDYLVVHDVDQFLWNFGTDIESVYSTAGKFKLSKELKVDDFTWTTINFKNGATCVAYSSWIAPKKLPGYLDMELMINGTEGMGHLAFSGHYLGFSYDDRYDNLAFPVQDALVNSPGFDEVIGAVLNPEDQAFIDCLISGDDPPITGEDGVNSLKVAKAAEESLKTGQVVPVNI